MEAMFVGVQETSAVGGGPVGVSFDSTILGGTYVPISGSLESACLPMLLEDPAVSNPSIWPVIGPRGVDVSPPPMLVMSWMLDRLPSLFAKLRRMKYFCAWLATCVGVLDTTKFRDMLLQSPFPYFSNPRRNNLFHRERERERERELMK